MTNTILTREAREARNTDLLCLLAKMQEMALCAYDKAEAEAGAVAVIPDDYGNL